MLSAKPAVSLRPGMRSRLPISAATSEPDGAEPDSRVWLSALRSPGAERDEAVARLHELLVRAARFEVSRRRAALSYVRGEELEDLALQAADDALVAVLAKLDDYRGASRFTTWAYKFALLEAGVRLRRRVWQEQTEAPLHAGSRRLQSDTPASRTAPWGPRQKKRRLRVTVRSRCRAPRDPAGDFPCGR